MKLVIHFYLVRHGQTRLNRSRRLQGTTNSPLTKKGIRMAKRLGQELKNIRFEAVYTSDLQRTKETARYILAENKQGKDCNILIVTHGLILSNFLESLNGDVPLFLVDNSRASRVDYADGKFKIIYINQLKQEES